MTLSFLKGRKRTCITGFVGVQAGLVLLYIGLFAQPWSKDMTKARSDEQDMHDLTIRHQNATIETRVSPLEDPLRQVRWNTTTNRREASVPAVDPEYAKLAASLRSSSTTDEFSVVNNLAEWFPLHHTQPASLTIRGVRTQTDDKFSSWFVKSPVNDSHLCFKGGLSTAYSPGNVTNLCICRAGWMGQHCSIPDAVSYSLAKTFLDPVKLRNSSRKVINAIAFNIEFDLLEARLHELNDMVDLFVIYESNYTLFGQAKPLRLLQKLMDGYLKAFHHKMYYLFLGTFPRDSRKDGWFAEEYERMYIGKKGMGHILGLKPDDLFIYTDADEIPSKEALFFLKTHDGYPEPFGFSLRWSVYSFVWKQNTRTDITAGCSVRMFRYIYSNNAQKLRVGEYEDVQTDILKDYLSSGGTLHRWFLFGDGRVNPGWHCSWCLTPDLIRIKLISAVNADFPRWGSFPEKLDLTYISNLVKTGTWFDDVTKFDSLVSNQTDKHFAPNFFLKNWQRFKYILDLGSRQ